MTAHPETHYARTSDGVHVAYQVVGDGPVDLAWIPGFVSHVEFAWTHPPVARLFRKIASFSRLILFDKRGTGMSDRVASDYYPDLETRMIGAGGRSSTSTTASCVVRSRATRGVR